MMAVIGTFAFNFSVTVPLLVKRSLGGGTSTFTFVFSVLSLGSLVGALWTARRKEVTGRHLVVSAVAFGLSMLLFAAAPNLGLVFPAAILLGLASITFMTSSTAIVQLVASPAYRGRVLAIQAMVFLGSTPNRWPDHRLAVRRRRCPRRSGRRRHLVLGRRCLRLPSPRRPRSPSPRRPGGRGDRRSPSRSRLRPRRLNSGGVTPPIPVERAPPRCESDRNPPTSPDPAGRWLSRCGTRTRSCRPGRRGRRGGRGPVRPGCCAGPLRCHRRWSGRGRS